MAFRLINTMTLKLENFNEERIPSYAILSHTWEDEEVSYTEMISINSEPSHPAAQKSGYLKIRAMCEEARSQGFEFAWIDTCCINPSSSSELTEAINSMFNWYRRADICFVYFFDLSPTSDVEHDMARCKWFTRGWCLQELIAPRNIRFYNNGWEYIGNKSTTRLRQLISRITRIAEAVLSDANLLPTLSVAQKMSWASRRETLRPEDIAYCLLGIFDINMPMLYGEGSKAFLRLQEEIIKKSNDLSIFAWDHPMPISAGGQEQYGPTDHDNDDRNSFSTDPNFCRDLFAQSPTYFSGCGNIVLPHNGAFRNLAFSMTNNGLFLQDMDLRLSFDGNCYLLPLFCLDNLNSPTEMLYLMLKMVQVQLYVRLRQHDVRELFRTNKKVNGYVLTHMTPPTRNRIASSHIKSVQLRSPLSSKSILCESLLEISPPDIWDTSRLAFLRFDRKPFDAYCKVNGRKLCQAQVSPRDTEQDYFYLAWGSLILSDNIRSRETIWVRLYSLEAWKAGITLGSTVFMQADSNQASGLETDQLRLASLDVIVNVISIEDLGSSFFRIDIQVRNIGIYSS